MWFTETQALGNFLETIKRPLKVKNNTINYFVADRKDSVAGKPVFNRTVTLRDAWQNTAYSTILAKRAMKKILASVVQSH